MSWNHLRFRRREGKVAMIREYIEAALQQAHYEIIEDDEPYYGEVEGLQGVWAQGKSLEECRANLADVIDGWLLVRISKGMLLHRSMAKLSRYRGR